MKDIRYELLMNNNFLVTIGNLSFSFSKVTNISDSVEYETIQEGGVNESPIFLYKGRTKPETIRFEKGILTGEKEKSMAPLKTGILVYAVTIIVKKNNKASKMYYFDRGLITKWEVGNLEASGKEILIKSIEITHTGLHEKPVTQK